MAFVGGGASFDFAALPDDPVLDDPVLDEPAFAALAGGVALASFLSLDGGSAFFTASFGCSFANASVPWRICRILANSDVASASPGEYSSALRACFSAASMLRSAMAIAALAISVAYSACMDGAGGAL